MIYLIKSIGYKEEEGKISTFFLLKIGYTEDSKKDKRFLQYKMHNPTCKVLYEILGGDTDIEKRIQYKFKNLLFEDYGKEWFYYSEEIINFFESIDNIEDLRTLPKGSSNYDKYSKYKNEIKEILKYISDIPCRSREFRKLYDEVFDILGDKITDKEYTLDYLRSKFGNDRIEKYLEIKEKDKLRVYSDNDIINREAYDFLEEYNSLTEARKKMILLCESSLNGKLSKESINIILSQIPDSDYIKSYYNTLGPERLKNLGYIRSNIEKALGIVMFSDDLLLDSIYSSFKESEKYTLSELKSRLASIYSSINYQSTPKASDIENWFEIKEIFIYEKKDDGSRKRIRGTNS